MSDMSKKAFDKIVEGLNEALAISRGTSAVPARLVVPADTIAALQKAVADLQAEVVNLKGELFRLSELIHC